MTYTRTWTLVDMRNISRVALGQHVLSRPKEAPVPDNRNDEAYWARGVAVEELMAAKGAPALPLHQA